MAANTRYQWVLILLLSFNFGIVFFDRNAFGFLAPFIQPDLGLTNTQIGYITAALSFSWALAGLFVGWLSDRLGRRKVILVFATLLFSAASVLSGFAGGVLTLMAARLLMGISEGGIMPISQTLIAAEVSPERRGLAMGIAQNFGANVIANSLGPVIIVAIASAAGWRNAFYLAALPGFLMTLLIALLIREPAAVEKKVATEPGELGRVLRDPTIVLCILISILLVAYLVVFSVFTPLYLVQVRGIDQKVMSWIMSAFGFASILIAFIVPGASDRLGRKPVAIVASLLGVILPAGLLFTSGTSPWPLAASLALGAAISGVFPLVMAAIPSEIVKPAQMATALSLTMGTSEIIGGVFAPTIAGWAADSAGLAAPLWIIAVCALACGLLAMGVRETAPVVLARRRGLS
jgi:MFS transporter, ACS family, hexuronate transporter